LQSGDSTSRVLPVEKIADKEYQISFENEFNFQADSFYKYYITPKHCKSLPDIPNTSIVTLDLALFDAKNRRQIFNGIQ